MGYAGRCIMSSHVCGCLFIKGLPLPLAHVCSLAKYAALCGFWSIVSMLLVCFDPPLERYRSRSFNF